MHIAPLHEPATKVGSEWLAFGVFDGQTTAPAALAGTPLAALIERALAAKDLPCGVGDATVLLGPGGISAGDALAFGLGPREKFRAGEAFSAGVTVAKRLAGKKRERVAVLAPEQISPDLISALVEGLVVGTQGPGLRKSEPSRHPIGELLVVSPTPDRGASGAFDKAIQRGAIVGEAVNLARELVNTPPAEKTPGQLASRALEIAAALGIKVDLWDEDNLRAERFGGLLGVAAGSAEPPAYVQLDYRRGGSSPTLCLVGKGVTFDSGGLSLKPSASMEDMKADMTGAAVVLAAMQAAARLGLPVNLRGAMVLTENMTGGKALKLGDVLSMRDGKTVEVLNTDAEGRLILADALAHAAELKPHRILDLATLTGACMVALGTKIAGLFSNDEVFAADILAACGKTGERAWRMPLDDDFDELLKSQVADMKNIGGKWGGAVTAAKFLQRFTGDIPWAHLDIAGPSWADGDSSTRDAGGTGCFVRTLVALFEAMAGRTEA